jgi:DNA-binding CsgD family transcriptional regulator
MLDSERKELEQLKQEYPELVSLPMPALPKDERDKAIVAMTAAGAGPSMISEALDIARKTVYNVLRKDENKKVVQIIRDAAKTHAVAGSFKLQKKYLEALDTLPVTKDTAATHQRIAAAFAILDKAAALAAGEATERTESKVISINLTEKREMVEQLRAARELRSEREGPIIDITPS